MYNNLSIREKNPEFTPSTEDSSLVKSSLRESSPDIYFSIQEESLNRPTLKSPTLWSYGQEITPGSVYSLGPVTVSRETFNTQIMASYFNYKASPTEKLTIIFGNQYLRLNPNANSHDLELFMNKTRKDVGKIFDAAQTGGPVPLVEKEVKELIGFLPAFIPHPVGRVVGSMAGNVSNQIIDYVDQNILAPEQQIDAQQAKVLFYKIINDHPTEVQEGFIAIGKKDPDVLKRQVVATMDPTADYKTAFKDPSFRQDTGLDNVEITNDNGQDVTFKNNKSVEEAADEVMRQDDLNARPENLSPKDIPEFRKILTDQKNKTSEILNAEADYLRQMGEKQAKYGIFTQFVGLFNPQLGKKLEVAGNAFFHVQDILHKFENNLIGEWAMVFGIESIVVGAIFSIFSSPGPNADQITIDLLNHIQEQIRDLQLEMEQGFEGVQNHLFAMHQDLIGRLEILKHIDESTLDEIETLHGKADTLQETLDYIKTHQQGSFQTLDLKDFTHSKAECLDPDVKEGAITEPTIQNCFNAFKLTAKTTATDYIFSPDEKTEGIKLSELPAKIKQFYRTDPTLENDSLHFPILFLMNLARSHFGSNMKAPRKVGNLTVWGMGVDGLIELLEKWPQKVKEMLVSKYDFKTMASEIEERIIPYTDFAASIVKKGVDKKNVLDRVMELYLSAVNEFNKIFIASGDSYLKDPPLQGDVKGSEATQFLSLQARESQVKIHLFNDEILENYDSPGFQYAKATEGLSSPVKFTSLPDQIPVPSYVKSMVDPQWLMAEALNLGHLEVSYQVSGFQSYPYKVHHISQKRVGSIKENPEYYDVYHIYEPRTGHKIDITIYDEQKNMETVKGYLNGRWGTYIFKINVNFVTPNNKLIPIVEVSAQEKVIKSENLMDYQSPKDDRIRRLIGLIPSMDDTQMGILQGNSDQETNAKNLQLIHQRVKERKDLVRYTYLMHTLGLLQKDSPKKGYEEKLVNAFDAMRAYEELYSEYLRLSLSEDQLMALPLQDVLLGKPSILSPDNFLQISPLFQTLKDCFKKEEKNEGEGDTEKPDATPQPVLDEYGYVVTRLEKSYDLNKLVGEKANQPIITVNQLRKTSDDELSPYQLAAKIMDKQVEEIIEGDDFQPSPSLNILQRLDELNQNIRKILGEK